MRLDEAEDAATNCQLTQDENTLLVRIKMSTHHGQRVHIYQAEPALCGACPHTAKCCPQTAARRIAHVIESAAVEAHDQRMLDPAIQALYKKTKQLAEYPNLRIKAD